MKLDSASLDEQVTINLNMLTRSSHEGYTETGRRSKHVHQRYGQNQTTQMHKGQANECNSSFSQYTLEYT